MEGPTLGPGGEDITWPDQVAPRGRKASNTRKIKPQTSNLSGERLRALTHKRIEVVARYIVRQFIIYSGDMMNCQPELAQVSPPPL